MSSRLRRGRVLVAALAAVVVPAVATLPLTPVAAQDEIGFGGAGLTATTETPLVGGYYYWSIAVDQQVPARVFGVPEEAYQGQEAAPLTVRIDWGDGSPDVELDTMDDPATFTEGSIG